MSAEVTVCVPAYEATAFVGDALASVTRQADAAWRLVVSVDRSDDETLELCRRLTAGEPRAEVVASPVRLGWLANTAAAVARVRTPFYLVLADDDVLVPGALSALLAAAAAEPGALGWFGDVETFGLREQRRVAPALDGPLLERLLGVLSPNFAIPWRGLYRSDPNVSRTFTPYEGGTEGADELWVFRRAIAGPLVRVPAVVYRKRVRAQSTSQRWGREPADVAARKLEGLLGALLADVDAARLGHDERRLVRAAICVRHLLRLTSPSVTSAARFGLAEAVSVSRAALRSAGCDGLEGLRSAADLDPRIDRSLATLLLRDGRRALEQGHLEEALERFEEARRRSPRDAAAANAAGWILVRQARREHREGRSREALRLLDRARTLPPRDSQLAGTIERLRERAARGAAPRRGR